MNLTLTEKILFSHCKVEPTTVTRGETYLTLTPDRVIMQDATAQMAMLQLIASGIQDIKCPASIHCDHLIKTCYGDEEDLRCAKKDNREVYDFLKSCCGKYGIDWWGPGKGIIHQIALENYDGPGKLIFGSDSHTPTGGAVSGLSIGVGGADIVDALVGEGVELMMPKIYNINLTGRLKPFVTSKDIILYILMVLGTKGGTGYVLEYTDGVGLSIEDRATICNMGAECGATTSVFQSDGWCADPESMYDNYMEIDVSKIEPQISGPFSPDLSESIRHKDFGCAPRHIDTVLIGSCTNSSFSDLHTIARYLYEYNYDLKTKLIILPGSEGIWKALEECGDIDVFRQCGVMVATPSCGPCIGQWTREDAGENTIITTFNRNFRGRNDGNKNTYAFITSPITAFRYALSGDLDNIVDLPELSCDIYPEIKTPIGPQPEPGSHININSNSDRLQFLPKFPNHTAEDFEELPILRKITGKCTTDNISPAGKWLRYRGHLGNISRNFLLTASFTKDYTNTPYEDAKALVKTVVVGDWNYGEGSSREHAALEARYLGVQCVIARSFARIHETNLKKQGVLPLTFADPNDYDLVHEDSVISVDTSTLQSSNEVLVKVDDTIIKTHHTLSSKQLRWLWCGSSLNYIRHKSKSIPYIEGDGIGPEVIQATIDIISTLRKDLCWIPIQWDDYDTIREYGRCLKGPLATPVGGGHRSYNVQMRQDLDLYACIRPIEWYGNESPVKCPEKVNMVVFRENTEDVYAGYEFKQGSFEADVICSQISLGRKSAVGIKVISEERSKRLMESACRWAMLHNRKHITIVHKGNIMKYTEGAFREWCYEVSQNYPEITVDDCICDAFLQNSLLHPEKYDVIVTTNLNGDYISDALAAQVGGIGISPGVNTNGEVSVYEATHGTAPDIAGKNLASPLSCLLSGCMMLEQMGDLKSANRIRSAIRKSIPSDPKTTTGWVSLIKINLNG